MTSDIKKTNDFRNYQLDYADDSETNDELTNKSEKYQTSQILGRTHDRFVKSLQQSPIDSSSDCDNFCDLTNEILEHLSSDDYSSERVLNVTNMNKSGIQSPPSVQVGAGEQLDIGNIRDQKLPQGPLNSTAKLAIGSPEKNKFDKWRNKIAQMKKIELPKTQNTTKPFNSYVGSRINSHTSLMVSEKPTLNLKLKKPIRTMSQSSHAPSIMDQCDTRSLKNDRNSVQSRDQRKVIELTDDLKNVSQFSMNNDKYMEFIKEEIDKKVQEMFTAMNEKNDSAAQFESANILPEEATKLSTTSTQTHGSKTDVTKQLYLERRIKRIERRWNAVIRLLLQSRLIKLADLSRILKESSSLNILDRTSNMSIDDEGSDGCDTPYITESSELPKFEEDNGNTFNENYYEMRQKMMNLLHFRNSEQTLQFNQLPVIHFQTPFLSLRKPMNYKVSRSYFT